MLWLKWESVLLEDHVLIRKSEPDGGRLHQLPFCFLYFSPAANDVCQQVVPLDTQTNPYLLAEF